MLFVFKKTAGKQHLKKYIIEKNKVIKNKNNITSKILLFQTKLISIKL